MKKTFFAIIASVALVFGFAATASAQCVAGCETVVTTTTNSPPPPVPTTDYTVGGGAVFNGYGAAVFQGTEGFAMTEKKGYGGIDLTLSATGSTCGFNCSTGGFTFAGYAGEHVKASAGALSTTSGAPAAIANSGGAFGGVTINIQKALNGVQ